MLESNPTLSRKAKLEQLSKEYFDLIIIGGGITGAGIALDAVSRGLKVALFEKNDFASGTSSKSTKLIHGGLRYLKQYEFSLVREVGKERATVHKIATHLVRPEKMLLPLIKGGNYGKIITSVGLMVYDVLADVSNEDQRKMLTVDETIEIEPLLDEDRLEGGGLYSEYQTDDFRLVIELIKKAEQMGVVVMNYAPFVNFLEKAGSICGVEIEDLNGNETIKVYSDFVINSTGPWADEVRSTQEHIEGKHLHLTKGVHIVVPHQKLPVKQSVYFDVPDGRMMFAIPRHKVTYIGTTDTDFTGNPDEVRTTEDDVYYILDSVNNNFPTAELKLEDVLSSWAGVRPLIEEEGKSASEISRKDEIFVSDKGLITIAGGKLTGYRKMAKRAVDQLMDIRSDSHSITKEIKSKTKKIRIPGNDFKSYKSVKKYKIKLLKQFSDINPDIIDYLVDLYGSQAESILQGSKPSLILSEVDFCIRNEMVLHLVDFYIYRTGRLFFDVKSIEETLTEVADYMALVFEWTNTEKQHEISTLEKEIRLATVFS
ncbi:glycerol-3-phosphate dehydrogenase/oxidase [Reichenbachiella versicolor]|uniref:glycerol-3-phosphate dehydrogenase/oxidase n=1 Tax=Reichenbachiella versicolor TaxID=1821036 RepID=UPI000D6E6DF7|nr:glycerol-3-phosphate dehydrogenase/oxidase [Reichenbachiella versicolor]